MENKEKKGKSQSSDDRFQQGESFLPSLDFSAFVIPFYSQAAVTLGLIADPSAAKEPENLELAKRLIDLLDLLKEKTRGNLRAEEEKFLESCLSQLKMAYLEKARIIKL